MIWCVEDDAGIREIELYALRSTGMEARGFADGDAFWQALQTEQPELVVLDVMLPGTDGVTLLQQMKQTPTLSQIPVIMATAKGTEFDKIQSLDLGADDYLVKPFGMMEMVSRVKAVLRRCAPRTPATQLTCGGIVMDTESHIVTVEGAVVELTLKEFSLLRFLMTHPHRAFTRDELFNEVWQMDFVGETRTVDMHVRTLRQKLGACGDRIETVRGVGYRLGDGQ